MKRFSADVCNLESRMRKRAAIELQGTLKQKQEDERLNRLAQMDVPSDLVTLGDDYFATVCSFKGFTSVHIRKFIPDDDGDLSPTKDGITFSPVVWDLLRKEILTYRGNENLDKVTVVNKSVSVTIQTVGDKQMFVFQKLFQRKNLMLQFLPNYVVLNDMQFSNLKHNASILTEQVKENLITETLQYYVNEELQNVPDLGYSTSFDDMTESLIGCILNSVDLKINELYLKCENFESRFTENILLSRPEKFQKYFESSLYHLDWRLIAKDFVEKSKNLDIKTLIEQEEYFDSLNVNTMFEKFEKLYIGDEESVNDLFIC